MPTPRSNRRLQYHSPTGTPPGSQGSAKKRLDGLYQDGEWFCNCEPRNEAKYFTVKKKGRNNGRGFYTCSTRSCKFFLWEDDAKARQMGGEVVAPPQPQLPAVREEATTVQKNTLEPYFSSQRTKGQSSHTMSELSTDEEVDFANLLGRFRNGQAGLPETPSALGTKRKRLEPDEDLFGEMGSEEERELAEAAERSSQKLQKRSSPGLFVEPTTPDNPRTHDVLGGMPTPSVTRTLFPGPDSKRQRTQDHSAAQAPSSGLHSPAVTPIAVRTRDVALDSPHHDDDYDLTEDVMCLLRGQKIDEPIARAVRESLDKYALRTKGIARGRDLVRATLKARDDRIAELQERVVALENKNKQQRDSITNFKASIMDLYSKH